MELRSLLILSLAHIVSPTSVTWTSSPLPTSTQTATEYTTTVSTSPVFPEQESYSGQLARADTGIVTRALPYPDCSDKTTYRNYFKTSQYKLLDNNIAWDWIRRKSCNLTEILLPPEPDTCGDCDFELTGGAWYRFPIGSLGQIVGYPDGTSCPKAGHCNGYGQITLIPSMLPPGHPSAKYFGLLISNNPSLHKDTCYAGDLEDPSQMVQAFQCPDFTLYQFPKEPWDSLDPKTYCRLSLNGTVVPIPSSICLGDELSVLQGNRKYFSSSEHLSCSNTRSPSPPKPVMWTDQDNQNITSLATRDTANSSLFTAVYSLNSSASYTRVTCQVEEKSHTFYRVSLEASNVTGVAGKEVSATCKVTFDTFSSENEENVYLIEVLNGSEVYYTSQNISTNDDKMVIDKESSGTYRVTLILSNTTLSSNVRNQTENWKCGVRDPITELYTTVPFTITINRNCTPGTGFVTSDSAECKQCPENTFPNQNICEDCPEGEISNSGADTCEKERDWGEAVYYVFAGVGAALFILLVLIIGAIYCSRRRKGRGDVVISNPATMNNISKTSV